MARKMAALHVRFAEDADRALSLVDTIEVLRATLPVAGGVRKQLTPSRIEAVYETSYFRIFLHWESFLEEACTRFLCGYQTTAGPQALRQPQCKSLSQATTVILAGRSYAEWAHPDKAITNAKKFIAGGVLEAVLASAYADLLAFVSIRNRIAHRSEFARQNFDKATVQLAGRTYRGSSAGRFLRDPKGPARWLQAISDDLKNLAVQITS